MITFQPLAKDRQSALLKALRSNGESGSAIVMDRKDTSFVDRGTEEVTDEEVINVVRSIPCHY